jgi:hypothetical protein
MTSNSVKDVFDQADDIKLLWESEYVQSAYSRRNKYQMVECARYFLKQVHTVMAEAYVPSNQDMVQTRVRTEGIIEHTFEMSKNSKGASSRKRGRTLILVSDFFCASKKVQKIWTF